MSSWVALKCRADCPECGLPVMLHGPWPKMRCPSCHAETPIAYYWTPLVNVAMAEAPGGRRFALGMLMDTGQPVPSLHYAVNKNQPPICSGCDAALDVATQIETGTDGTFQCPGCGVEHNTFPAPRHMQAGAAQIFLAARESEQLGETAAPDAKPIMFNCSNCGGNLKITTDTTRIMTCEYCEVDLFLPQTLWNALHPVRKRRAFWVRMR